MKLNLLDQLELLALDDYSGSKLTPSGHLQYGLAAAIILELTLNKRISVLGKKVVVTDRTLMDDSIIDPYFIQILQTQKPKTLQHWVSVISRQAHKIEGKVISKLVALKILTIKKKKVLWLFTVRRYPMINHQPEREFRKQLYDIVHSYHKPTANQMMLLQLIQMCHLERAIFPTLKRKEFVRRVKQLHSDINMGDMLQKEIEAMQAAMVALTASIAATTVVVTS
ncbi:GPP34 family phosphoprotein [Prolixibacteraceae bacterium JC049]|nr:GPP34 family phosphoprotein [Prolixibacteraceae bacterium JC049]